MRISNMRVAELIAVLSSKPQDAEVFVRECRSIVNDNVSRRQLTPFWVGMWEEFPNKIIIDCKDEG
jgi:Iap family predicted aminopeptidase